MRSAPQDRHVSDGSVAGHALNALCALHPALFERRVGEAIVRNVPRQLRAVHAPGAQFALGVGERPCVGWSFGEARQGLPMDPCRAFRVASLSKPVSAFVVLRLVETAGLDLDEPLDRHLAGIAGLPRGVTFRLLLSHRAGLRDCTSPLVAVGDGATMDDVLAGRLGEQHVPCFAAPVGVSTQYTSAGYMLLQIALERLTGRGFADLARALVFEPLDMRDSGFEPHPPREFGVEHDASGRALPDLCTPCLASTGLWSTPGDLVRLGREVVRCARGAGGLLAPHLARQMFEASGEDATFALGFHVVRDAPTRSVSHGAVRPGLRGLLLVLPEVEVVFAALVNGAEGTEIIRPLRGLVTDLGARRERRLGRWRPPAPARSCAPAGA